MKIAIVTDSIQAADTVYSGELQRKMRERFEICEKILTKKDIGEYAGFLRETEYIFSTWGMPRFSGQEIKAYFPVLKGVFYAAGSVQSFAREFLECGVPVYSAWVANGIPVAEFTFAQIILAGKRYFRCFNKCKTACNPALDMSTQCIGNYKSKIGVCGAGVIGGMVCEKLKTLDCEVLVFDKFLSSERAQQLGVRLVSLEEMFSQCDIITNHLADKDELTGIFDYKLFSSMKKGSTFINTGRGRQVNEADLVRAFIEDKTKTALLDVTCPEPPLPDNPLLSCENIFITPHIAGSMSVECNRMADFMFEELQRILGGEPAKYEVTPEMLATMA